MVYSSVADFRFTASSLGLMASGVCRVQNSGFRV